MLKILLGCILSLGLMGNVAANVFGPKECPDVSQFAHGEKGSAWSLSAGQAADWRVEVSSGPGHDSALSSMDDKTNLDVHLIPTLDFRGVGGVICTYTLSDQTILNVHARHVDGLDNCFGISSNIGNFEMKTTSNVSHSAWHRFWRTTHFTVFEGAFCSTSANLVSYCNWSQAMTSNPYGVLHFCSGVGVPVF